VQLETQAAVSNMVSVSQRMHNGVALAKQGGDSLAAIREHAVQTDSVVHDIAAATREQTVAGEQIARSVQDISGKAEESAEIASRTQRAVTELLSLSSRLNAMVQRFELG
jgi:methyl-accepting chemotaxis protein